MKSTIQLLGVPPWPWKAPFEALCFLIEVDNIIHASFLGESFEKRVTHRCEVITVSASAQGTWQPYVFLAVVLLLGRHTGGFSINGGTPKWMVYNGKFM